MDRSERMGLMLSPREKDAVRRLAEVEGGLSQAALVRRLIRREARRLGLWPRSAARSQESAEVRGALAQKPPLYGPDCRESPELGTFVRQIDTGKKDWSNTEEGNMT